MSLVHHNVLEVRQDPGELGVHRQDAPVQHVWVGDQQLRSVPGLASVCLQDKQKPSKSNTRQTTGKE